MKMIYTRHYKEDAQGSIFIKKAGACNINLIGAAAMSQEELDKFGKLFANALKMETVINKLIESLPELDNENESLDGSDAVDVLCQLWDEIKNSVKP